MSWIKNIAGILVWCVHQIGHLTYNQIKSGEDPYAVLIVLLVPYIYILLKQFYTTGIVYTLILSLIILIDSYRNYANHG